MAAKKRTQLQPLLFVNGSRRGEYLFVAQGDRGGNGILGVKILDAPPVIVEGEVINGREPRLLKRAPPEANAVAYDPRERVSFTSCEQEGDVTVVYRAVVYCVMPKPERRR